MTESLIKILEAQIIMNYSFAVSIKNLGILYNEWQVDAQNEELRKLLNKLKKALANQKNKV